MSNFTKKITSVLIITGFCCVAFFSCQKAVVEPYSSPSSGIPNTITPPTFSAIVNSGIKATSFTPVKTIQNGYVTLKGVSTNYIITFSFPVTLSAGNYFIGGNSDKIRATVFDGTTTYVNDINISDAGSIDFTSINQGKYTATFSFFAEDSTNTFNSIDIYDGSLTNM